MRVKSSKSYKYIFWFVFEVCILNSFILSKYTQCTHNPTFLSFRQQIVCQLIGNYNSRKHKMITRRVIYHNLVCSVAQYQQNLGSSNRGLVNLQIVISKLCGIVRHVINVCVM